MAEDYPTTEEFLNAIKNNPRDVADVLQNKVRVPASAIIQLAKMDWVTPEDMQSLGSEQEVIKKNLIETLEFAHESPAEKRTLLKVATAVMHCHKLVAAMVAKDAEAKSTGVPPPMDDDDVDKLMTALKEVYPGLKFTRKNTPHDDYMGRVDHLIIRNARKAEKTTVPRALASVR